MIEIIKGNILDHEHYWKVNTVNCFGVMGKGIALQFKNKFPEMFQIYRDLCLKKQIQIGKCWIYEPDKIICFPTKYHWSLPSKYEYLEKGLDDLKNKIKEFKIEKILIPPLGCGCGGLEFSKVKNIITNSCSDLNIDIKIIHN